MVRGGRQFTADGGQLGDSIIKSVLELVGCEKLCCTDT